MELQVMILDDEYIILDGLCSFPWSDYGYRISATVRIRSGFACSSFSRPSNPFLAVADIRYP